MSLTEAEAPQAEAEEEAEEEDQDAVDTAPTRVPTPADRDPLTDTGRHAQKTKRTSRPRSTGAVGANLARQTRQTEIHAISHFFESKAGGPPPSRKDAHPRKRDDGVSSPSIGRTRRR